MRKIPCLFRRDFHGHDHAVLRDEVTPGCEWVLAGEGKAYRKWDGTACLVNAGVLYKRYDAKRGKTPPKDAIPCDAEPDATTGHWPHWVPVGKEPESKWHAAAWEHLRRMTHHAGPSLGDGTYELCGPHFNANAEQLTGEVFMNHRAQELDVPRTFDGIRAFLSRQCMEGIVFHDADGRMAKIRRKDYGFDWPCVAKAEVAS